MEIEEAKTQLVSGKISYQNNWVPEEILLCILQNLPGKSLIRFQCVNKPWNFMISDSDIIDKTPKLILHDLNSMFLMDYEDPGKVRKLNLPTKIKPKFVCARASCNGILWMKVNSEEMLWNPFTGEHEILPIQSHVIDRCNTYGFGYDHTTKDYKVITITQVFYCSEQFIYSVKNDSCEPLEENILQYSEMRFDSCEGISIKNGSFCYWPISYASIHGVFGFDVINRRQIFVSQLPVRVKWRITTRLTEFKDSLCAMNMDYEYQTMEIWPLQENWEKLMSVDINMKWFYPLPWSIYITKDEEVLMFEYRGRILVYAAPNSLEKRFRYVKDYEPNIRVQKIVYYETLASIRS